MGMSEPEDSPQVVSALRLGWYVAEVRGRNRPDGPRPPAGLLPDRRDHVLPLRVERTPAELRIEAQVVLSTLAGDLGVDEVTVDDQQQSQTALIDERARALAAAPPDTAAAAGAWQALAESIFDLDAHAQDALAAQSEMQAAAYQFGRGLAEVYWALDPDVACEPMAPDCWTFLLGEHRCAELTRLAGRLSAYFNPYCPPAIAGTLRLWQSVASDEQWRSGAQDHLYQQSRRWYELVILGQDPSTLIKPYQLVRNWQVTLRATQALWIPLLIAAVSLGLVVALITVSIEGSAGALLKALLGVLGVVGLSAASAQAGLKGAQGLLTRLRQDAYTDLVAVAIALAPDKPGARRPRRVVAEEVRKRTLTTTVGATVP
jgi:hypothetical protein